MNNLFISYSRKDIDYARRLTHAFTGKELDIWIDWEDIPPTVDWWLEVEKGIEEADIFLFLLSPNSAKSEVCKKEIKHAVKNGKRLIPVVVKDVEDDNIPTEFSHLNWIFLRENDDFNAAFDKLLIAVETDFVWVKTHRQLQVKALEWERSNFEKSFLLRGKELQEAEHQLATNTSKQPYPTDLQREYVHKSRRASDRQRGITSVITLVGLVAMAGLAIFGFMQAGFARAAQTQAEQHASIAQTAQAEAVNEAHNRAAAQAQAEEQAKIARSGELAAQAKDLAKIYVQRPASVDITLPLLLSLESSNIALTLDPLYQPKSKASLLEALNLYPIWYEPSSATFIQFQGMDNERVWSFSFNPDQTLAATGGYGDGKIWLWNTMNGQQFSDPLEGHNGRTSGLAFSPDGKTLASTGCTQNCDKVEIRLWDIAGNGGLLDFKILPEGCGIYSDVIFNPQGTMLATSCSSSNQVQLWNISDNRTLIDTNFDTSLLPDSGSPSIAFSPTGNFIAIGNGEFIQLWDISNPAKPIPEGGSLSFGEPVLVLSFNQEGNMLAAGGGAKTYDDRDIRLWDTPAGIMHWLPLVGLKGSVTSLAFSPDGTKLVAGDANGSVHIWDVETSQPLGLGYSTGGNYIFSVTFNSDGNSIFAGNGDKSVWIGDFSQFHGLTLNKLMNQACQIVGRNFTLAEWEQYFPGEEYRLTCPQWPAGK